MSPAIREAIAFADHREAAALRLAEATAEALQDANTKITAIGIASGIAEHRREAARWREIAAVLRESATE